MNKISNLVSKWKTAVDKAEDALSDLDDYLVPIIQVLSPSKNIYTIVSVYSSEATPRGWRVETQDKWDGTGWSNFTIPFEILDAKNPLKAAQDYAAKIADKDSELKQVQIKTEIARLQGLLK